jgi:hypothetical protein
MTTQTWQLLPGRIASVMYVMPSGLVGEPISVVYASAERGVLVGTRDTPLTSVGWPLEVQAHINRYFARVFSLEHENWTNVGPSPRARYVDSAKPWTVTLTEEPS